MEKEDKGDRIKNRESWLKIFLIVIFAALIAWKILTSPLTINLADFRLSDLLSLILALFAVGLAVAFYFKATDTSNTFYDNTYKFTKEVSEILGRIEAGFGERLRHLDEGYAGLKDKFDRMPIDPVRAEKQVKKEEEELKKKEEERNRLIENLAERARLENNEKEELFRQLKRKDEELEQSRRQLTFLQHRLERAEMPKTDRSRPIDEMPMRFVQYVKERLIREIGIEAVMEAPVRVVSQRFDSIKADLPPDFVRELMEFGIIDKAEKITERGIKALRQFAVDLRR